MTKWPILAAIALATGAVSGAALADGPQQSKSNLSGSDKSFMADVARDDNAEIALGKLAQKKAQSDEVKQFAQHLVEDHATSNAGLMSLATQKGVDLGDITSHDQITSGQQHTYSRLSKLEGADFDREFMAEMVKEHRDDVADFDARLQKTSDPDLSAWTQQTLSTLRAHLEMAQRIQAKMKPSKE
jgi:putative membrane protein